MFRLASSRERLDQDLVQLFASPLRQMKRCDVSCDHPRSQTIGMTIRDWLGLGINSFCPSFCCTLRCYSLLFLIGPIDVFLSFRYFWLAISIFSVLRFLIRWFRCGVKCERIPDSASVSFYGISIWLVSRNFRIISNTGEFSWCSSHELWSSSRFFFSDYLST